MDDYELWRDRQGDNIAMNCSMWRTVLDYIEACPPKISKSDVVKADCLGSNGWDLSAMRKNYLTIWLSDSLQEAQELVRRREWYVMPITRGRAAQ